MDFSLVIKGLIAGLVIAVPIGPIGIVCVQRTLARGRAYGLASGLGAASADAFYGFLAGFGISYIGPLLSQHQVIFRSLGALILCILGIRAFRAKVALREDGSCPPINGIKFLRAYSSVFFLTLTNPATLISMVAIFVTLGVTDVSGRIINTGLLVMGIFFGSTFWWVTLSGSIGFLHKRFDHREIQTVNRVSGVLLLVFAFLVVLSMLP